MLRKKHMCGAIWGSAHARDICHPTFSGINKRGADALKLEDNKVVDPGYDGVAGTTSLNKNIENAATQRNSGCPASKCVERG